MKPIENRNVRGVASERYPLNKKCAHPECQEDAVDPHHTFPRSQIGNDSWFVEIDYDEPVKNTTLIERKVIVIPHVSGLCRMHHDLVESHGAWIKLEEGVFVWYDRYHVKNGGKITKGEIGPDDGSECPPERNCNNWIPLGPLNPQPGSVEGKTKRKKFKGEKRRKRSTVSIKVPQDEQEDGAGLLMDAVELLESKLYPDNPRPTYYTLMAALDYANLNADSTDFE